MQKEILKQEEHKKPSINQMKKITCPILSCKCTKGKEGKFLGYVYHPRGSPSQYLAYQCPKKKSKMIEITLE